MDSIVVRRVGSRAGINRKIRGLIRQAAGKINHGGRAENLSEGRVGAAARSRSGFTESSGEMDAFASTLLGEVRGGADYPFILGTTWAGPVRKSVFGCASEKGENREEFSRRERIPR